MKKIIFIIMLSLSATFFACGDDDITTLKWNNQSDEVVNDIAWQGYGDSHDDRTWTDVLMNNDDETVPQKITKLHGRGTAIIGGFESEIDVEENGSSGYTSYDPSTSYVRIIENADATLIIGGAAKKK